MKLNKSLLKAMVAGIALGTAVSSCSPFDSIVDTLTPDDDVITCTEPGDPRGGVDNCPACGMG